MRTKMAAAAVLVAVVAVAAAWFVTTRPPLLVHVTASGAQVTFEQTNQDGSAAADTGNSVDVVIPGDQLRSYQVTVLSDGVTATCRIDVSGGLEPPHSIENSTQGVDTTATCTYRR